MSFWKGQSKPIKSAVAAAGLACTMLSGAGDHAKAADPNFAELSRAISMQMGLTGKEKKSPSESIYHPGKATKTILRALYEENSSLEGITIRRSDGKGYGEFYIRLQPEIDWFAARLAFFDHKNNGADPEFNRYFEVNKELLLGMHVLLAKQFKQPADKNFVLADVSVARSTARQKVIAKQNSHSGYVSEHTMSMGADIKIPGVEKTELFAYALGYGMAAGYYRNSDYIHFGAGHTRYWPGCDTTVRSMKRAPGTFMEHGAPMFTSGPLPAAALPVMQKLEEFYKSKGIQEEGGKEHLADTCGPAPKKRKGGKSVAGKEETGPPLSFRTIMSYAGMDR